MQIVQPIHQQQLLLDRYSQMSGVVEFILIECDCSDDFSHLVEQHRQSVVLGMREIQKRLLDYAERVSSEQGYPLENFFHLTIDETIATNLIPRQVDRRTFLGTRYDFDRQGLIVRGKGNFSNDFFFYKDPVRADTVYPLHAIDGGVGTGFAYAFSAPPYGLSTTAADVGKLFEQILDELLCRAEKTVIFEWPTNWSNYFDAGNEWWGSFLWTLSNPGQNRVTMISASATD